MHDPKAIDDAMEYNVGTGWRIYLDTLNLRPAALYDAVVIDWLPESLTLYAAAIATARERLLAAQTTLTERAT